MSSSFVSKRFKITTAGTKDCRHEWHGDQCAVWRGAPRLEDHEAECRGMSSARVA